MNTYPMCDSALKRSARRGATSLRYRSRAQITVFVCEQKPLAGIVILPAQKLSCIV